MREHGFWESESPPDIALASQEPFCIDTLSFTQWLQFIFIARIKIIIENQSPLPLSSDIVPMAQEYFEDNLHARAIIEWLEAFDKLIVSRG